MNAEPLLAQNRTSQLSLHWNPPLPSLAISGRIRVAVFGSFYGGFHVLQELLGPDLNDIVQVVGVATDDPRQPFVHPDVRLWKYPHTRAEELLVSLLARAHGLPLYDGNIKQPSFQQAFFQDWCPDLCLMATFGQKIPRRLFSYPPIGFYNFHHSDRTWPSYPGPDPIAAMVRDGKKEVVITMHTVTDVLDGGDSVAQSHSIPIPANANAAIVHRITWPQVGEMIRRQTRALATMV